MDNLSEFSIDRSGSYVILTIDETDSTNDHLERLIQSGKSLPEKVVLCSGFQTKGRGMMHTHWSSVRDQNLLCSILVREVPLDISRQFQLSMTTCLAVVDCLSALNVSQDLAVKWPNDVFMNGQKICGILIQNSLKQNRISHSILGIGINVNQVDFEYLPEATSLQKISGMPSLVSGVLQTLLVALERRMEQLRAGSFSSLYQEYCQLLLGFQEWVTYESQAGTWSGKIVGLEEDGRIVIEARSGKLLRFEAKEIRRVTTR